MKNILLLGFLSLFSFHFFAQTQLGQDLDGEAAGDEFGNSTSLSANGNILAVGGPFNDENGENTGHVKIFSFNGSLWQQMGDDINGQEVGDQFGQAVSLSYDGTIIAVGAPTNNENGIVSGLVGVFIFDGIQWQQLGEDINGEGASDRSGQAVNLSADGSTVAIGAAGNDGSASGSGHVRVYGYNGVDWQQIGSDIDGEAELDLSGSAVSLSANGNIVAIGAPFNDANGFASGHARVFGYDGTNWQQLGADIDGEGAEDQFGSSVSLNADGNILAVGAHANDGNGEHSGHTRVFSYDGTHWQQVGMDIDGENAGDVSGASVSLNAAGDVVAIGAIGNDGNGEFSGHVRVFRLSGTQWEQMGVDIDGEAASNSSGNSVNLSADGSVVAIGAIFNDDNGQESGHARVFGDIPLGIDGNAFNSLELFPNPTKNVLNISSPEVIAQIVIYNMHGQKVLELKPSSTSAVMNVSYLSAGSYVVKTTMSDRQYLKVISKKITIYR